MAEEISLDRIGEYAHLFTDHQLDMVHSSIARGNTRARFWRSIFAKGCIVDFLWDQGNNVFYFAGTRITKEATADLASLIDKRIKKQAVEDSLARFKIRVLSPLLAASIHLHRASAST